MQSVPIREEQQREVRHAAEAVQVSDERAMI